VMNVHEKRQSRIHAVNDILLDTGLRYCVTNSSKNDERDKNLPQAEPSARFSGSNPNSGRQASKVRTCGPRRFTKSGLGGFPSI
jgi:hypothetical protein